MCPEVIFTSGAFQVNYYKETACEIHKKVLPVFSHHPGEETSFAATLEHRHEEKMINNAPNRQHPSFFKTVPGWKDFPSLERGSLPWRCVPQRGQRIPGAQGQVPHAPLSHLGFAHGVCKWIHDQTLQLRANVCQYINVILAVLRVCPTNREKPKPHGVWFMPTTGWTCWRILEAAPPKSVEMDKSLR